MGLGIRVRVEVIEVEVQVGQDGLGVSDLSQQGLQGGDHSPLRSQTSSAHASASPASLRLNEGGSPNLPPLLLLALFPLRSHHPLPLTHAENLLLVVRGQASHSIGICNA